MASSNSLQMLADVCMGNTEYSPMIAHDSAATSATTAPLAIRGSTSTASSEASPLTSTASADSPTPPEMASKGFNYGNDGTEDDKFDAKKIPGDKKRPHADSVTIEDDADQATKAPTSESTANVGQLSVAPCVTKEDDEKTASAKGKEPPKKKVALETSKEEAEDQKEPYEEATTDDDCSADEYAPPPKTSSGKKSHKASGKATPKKSHEKAAGSPSNRGRTIAFKSRRGPCFQGAAVEDMSDANDNPLGFSTTCYQIQLGEETRPWFIHEYNLSKSPRLYEEVKSSKKKARKTQQQIIHLRPHDATAFDQLVYFLYSDQFKPMDINKPKKKIGYRLKEVWEVYSLAKFYSMPDLQKDIMRVVKLENVQKKAEADAFFDWAEDMWYEEMDPVDGPFATFFRKHAPAMMLSVQDKDLASMLKCVSAGGEFVKEMFIAQHEALKLKQMPMVKIEPVTVDMV